MKRHTKSLVSQEYYLHNKEITYTSQNHSTWGPKARTKSVLGFLSKQLIKY